MHDMEDAVRKIAEKRIREAMERGEFQGLPGAGRPQKLADDRGVPEDLRMAFRVMRNAGCLPPELELRKEIYSLGELLRSVDDEDRRASIRRQIDYSLLKFSMLRPSPCHLDIHPVYGEKLVARLESGLARRRDRVR